MGGEWCACTGDGEERREKSQLKTKLWLNVIGKSWSPTRNISMWIQCKRRSRVYCKSGRYCGVISLSPPENGIVISADEKPSIQALSRKTQYVRTENGQIVRGIKSTYRRNGTLNLFAALEIATGKVFGKTTKYKKRPDFQKFLDELLNEQPNSDEIEYHIILDNYCTHKKMASGYQNTQTCSFTTRRHQPVG